MKAAARRLLALENSRDQGQSFGAAEVDRDRALRMMTGSELILAQLSLRGVCDREKWSDHDQERWGWSGPVMRAKAEIEIADDAMARSFASALMTRGLLRWLGLLPDVKFGPFRAWEERRAFPAFTDDAWMQVKNLAAGIRQGLVTDNVMFVRP